MKILDLKKIKEGETPTNQFIIRNKDLSANAKVLYAIMKDKINKDNIIITNLRYEGAGTRISFVLNLGEIEMDGIYRVNTIAENIDEAKNIINHVINYNIYLNNK